MAKEYTKLGATSADLINTLMGGGGYAAKGRREGAEAGSQIALRNIQGKKYSAETDKILQELSAQKAAQEMTGAEFGPGLGFTPEEFRQMQRYGETGKYDVPFEAELFPGETPIPGLRAETAIRPETVSPGGARGAQTALMMPALRKLAGGQGNIAQVMQALTGGIDLRTREQMMPEGELTPDIVAPIMAAMEGKDPRFASSRGQDPTRSREVDILVNSGVPREEAYSMVYGAQTAEQYRRDLLKSLAPVWGAKGAEKLADQLTASAFPDFKGAATAPPGNVVKSYK